ncbi:MAG: pyrroloquinoline quinone-dependent dehydrogenase [Micropepsaceae bacterium]
MQRLVIASFAFLLVTTAALAGEAGWSHYGGDEGGSRYSPAKQITPENVDNLIRAWEFSTGDLAKRDRKAMRRTSLQDTPILVGNKLLVCTSFNEIIALDPATGRQLWRFDPKIPTDKVFPANKFNCRGVAVSADTSRVFAATNDARILALDLKSGEPVSTFGIKGEVKIDPGMELKWPGEFQITSAPVVIGNTVIVGSSIGDNRRVDAPHGTVRAYDTETGKLKWTWDPIPREGKDPASPTWGGGNRTVGHANVWAPMSVDTKRGLVFLPTSSPSPDFFGGLRPGNNEHANSVVALKADTGELVWAFQTVHHDVWDYDNPAQPTLVTLNLDTGPRDVVIQPTKQGFLFVLDRDTGEPVFPVEERPVPQGGVKGETLSPTQTFPSHVPALVPQKLTADDAFGFTPWDKGACRDAIASARSDGLYTPPTEQGTILFPMTGGGVNWGGVTFDPVKQVLYVNTARAPHLIKLFPAEKFEELDEKYPDKEVSQQEGAPYGMIREVVLSPLGVPCNNPPWGMLAAVDLKAGKILWETTLGTTEELAPLNIALPTGTPTVGGSVVTASGLVFIGATMDKYLRAFEAKSGKELWQGRLPATGFATPMTYEYKGTQYVVIAAGGHGQLGTEPGDTFVAFRLAGPGEGPSLWSRTIDRPGGRMWINLAVLAIGGLLALRGLWWLVTRRRRL